ncbi:MAG: acyl-CoA dehydrogenase family protein, partial [Bacteroidota bacterium]
KRVCSASLNYANTREQFKMPIAKFGAIKHKLAEQAIRTFVMESALYRTSHQIDEMEKSLLSEGLSFDKALLGAAEEFAVECAILKVLGSEVLDFVVDEGVQIFGGYGYSSDFPMDRAYRDARINRILEGTNEINRLLMLDMLLKRAMKGEIDLMTPAQNVQKELMSIPDFGATDETPFAQERKLIANFKKAGLMIAGAAVQKYMMKLTTEQEIIMNVSDMIIETFASESVMLRVEKLVRLKGEASCGIYLDIMKTYLNDSADRIFISGKNAINAMAEGDENRMMMMGLKRFTKTNPFNTKDARRRIAKNLLATGTYKI